MSMQFSRCPYSSPWAILPLDHRVQYPVRDLGNQCRRHIGVIHFPEGIDDVAGAQALAIERRNLAVPLCQPGLALAHKLRFEGAGAVTGRGNLDLAVLPFRRFLLVPLRLLPEPRPAGSCFS